MSNLLLRSLTGIFLVCIISGAIFLGPYSFLVLIFIINLLTLLEFYNLFHSTALQPQKITGVLLSITISGALLAAFLRPGNWQYILINIPVISGISIIELFKRAKNPFQNIAITLLGVIFITFPLILFALIAFLPFKNPTYHSYIVLGYFLMLWASDSGAYAIGKAFGRHKLFLRISPGKTWEGSLGGAFSGLLMAYFASKFFPEMQVSHWMLMALIIVVTGTFGDLTKSLMKRSLKIKDSGTILPGHGGMLDRFDSLLGSAPFVFCYTLLNSPFN